MKLQPDNIDPSRLLKPTSVAARLGVHPSMVTHWLQNDALAYVDIDGVKFIPEEAVAVHESLRQVKKDRRAGNAAAAERSAATAGAGS